MCTSVVYKSSDLYFGRNLDLEYGYQEAVTVTPRNFQWSFKRLKQNNQAQPYYAMVGMAYTVDGCPLYYDAVNEMGLCMAGLNFPGFACYPAEQPEMDNILPCEFIPWILGRCSSVAEAKRLVSRTNLVNIQFRPDLPNTPLHWMIAGKDGTITVEPCENGLIIYENPVGVLTNSPPFEWHMLNLAQYANLTPEKPSGDFSGDFSLKVFSRGLGAKGLPGDLSSPSRFVKAAFAVGNSAPCPGEGESVAQFFHILDTVAHPRGMALADDGRSIITRYACCCNASKGIYYFVTYENRRINAVHLHHEELNGCEPVNYYPNTKCDICSIN